MQRLVSLPDFLFRPLVLLLQQSVLLFLLVLCFLEELGSLSVLDLEEVLMIRKLGSFPLAKWPRWRAMERQAVVQVETGLAGAHERVGSLQRGHACRLALRRQLLLFLCSCLLRELIQGWKVPLHLANERAKASSRRPWRRQLTILSRGIHHYFLKFVFI